MQAAIRQQPQSNRASGRRRPAVIALVALLGALGVVPGTSSEAAVPGQAFTETACEEYTDSIARLYTAGLGRAPDDSGFDFWLDAYWYGEWTLPRMAYFFVNSPEFQTRYGELDDEAFVRQLYRNVLGREGEAGGVEFWTRTLREGTDRPTVLLRFAESPENVTRSGTVEPILGPFNNGVNHEFMFRCGPGVDLSTAIPEWKLGRVPERPGLGDVEWSPDGAPWLRHSNRACLLVEALHEPYATRDAKHWVERTLDYSDARHLLQDVVVFPTDRMAEAHLEEVATLIGACGPDQFGNGATLTERSGEGDRWFDVAILQQGRVVQSTAFLRYDNVVVHAGVWLESSAPDELTVAEIEAWTTLVVEHHEAPSGAEPPIAATCVVPEVFTVQVGWTYCAYRGPEPLASERIRNEINAVGHDFRLTLDGGGYLPNELPIDSFRRRYPSMDLVETVQALLAGGATTDNVGRIWNGHVPGSCSRWTMHVDFNGTWNALYPDDPSSVGDASCP